MATLVLWALVGIFVYFLFSVADNLLGIREARLLKQCEALTGEAALLNFTKAERERLDAFQKDADELLVWPNEDAPLSTLLQDLPHWAKVAFSARVGRFLLSRFEMQYQEHPGLLRLARIAAAAERAAATGKAQPREWPLLVLAAGNDQLPPFLHVVFTVFGIIQETSQGNELDANLVPVLAKIVSASPQLTQELKTLTTLAYDGQWTANTKVPTPLFQDFDNEVPEEEPTKAEESGAPNLIPFGLVGISADEDRALRAFATG